MTINFRGGFIKTDGRYIKPENIMYLEPTTKGGTRIHFNAQTDTNQNYDWGNVYVESSHSPDKIADAIIKTENCGQLINLDA